MAGLVKMRSVVLVLYGEGGHAMLICGRTRQGQYGGGPAPVVRMVKRKVKNEWRGNIVRLSEDVLAMRHKTAVAA